MLYEWDLPPAIVKYKSANRPDTSPAYQLKQTTLNGLSGNDSLTKRKFRSMTRLEQIHVLCEWLKVKKLFSRILVLTPFQIGTLNQKTLSLLRSQLYASNRRGRAGCPCIS